jgi:uncharacterized protein (TIGR02147 family)
MKKEHQEVFIMGVSEIKVARFLHYSDYFKHLYEYVKKELRPYSFLKFSEDLGLGAKNNTLRLIIAGQRRLSMTNGMRVADALQFNGYEKKFFCALISFNNSTLIADREAQFKQLMRLKTKLLPETIDESRLAYFTEWYHPVIREMAARKDFQLDAKWIQSKIGFEIRLEEVKKSLELLSRLGLIHYDAKLDRHVRSDEQLKTGEDAKGIAFIRYHQKMIDLASQSITKVKKTNREILGATLNLPEDQVGLLRERIRSLFQDAMDMEVDDLNRSDSVVQLNIQLFPFIKG